MTIPVAFVDFEDSISSMKFSQAIRFCLGVKRINSGIRLYDQQTFISNHPLGFNTTQLAFR
jgi:hypothetical protein